MATFTAISTKRKEIKELPAPVMTPIKMVEFIDTLETVEDVKDFLKLILPKLMGGKPL